MLLIQGTILQGAAFIHSSLFSCVSDLLLAPLQLVFVLIIVFFFYFYKFWMVLFKIDHSSVLLLVNFYNAIFYFIKTFTHMWLVYILWLISEVLGPINILFYVDCCPWWSVSLCFCDLTLLSLCFNEPMENLEAEIEDTFFQKQFAFASVQSSPE